MIRQQRGHKWVGTCYIYHNTNRNRCTTDKTSQLYFCKLDRMQEFCLQLNKHELQFISVYIPLYLRHILYIKYASVFSIEARCQMLDSSV